MGELVDVEFVQRSQSAWTVATAVHHVAFVALGMAQEGVQLGECFATLPHNALEHLFLLVECQMALELKVSLSHKGTEWTAVAVHQGHIIGSHNLLVSCTFLLGIWVVNRRL